MVTIRTISKSVVKATSLPTDAWLGEKLQLSPADIRAIPSHVPIVYIFPKPSTEGCDIGILKKSLSLALAEFYPLCGRINCINSLDSEDEYEIECNNSGIPFNEAEADCTLTEAIPQLNHPDTYPDGFFPPQIPFINPISRQPLLTVQCTSFQCGGIVVCVSFHHMCTDGNGFFHFMHVWGCIARGEQYVKPCHDRSLNTTRFLPNAQPRAADKQKTEQNIAKRIVANLASFCTKSVTSLKCFVFFLNLILKCMWEPFLGSVCIPLSAQQLKKLKEMASANSETDNAIFESLTNSRLTTGSFSNVTYVSTDDAVTAAFLQAVNRARDLPPSALVTILRVADTRSRLNPPLPEKYFGNAVVSDHFTHFPISANELLSASLAQVARYLRKTLQGVDNDYCCQFWARPAPYTTMAAAVPPFSGRGAVVTSWLAFDIYSFDFGHGRPAFVSVTYGPKPPFLSGLIVLQPGAVEGVDVVVILPKEAIKRLLQDPVLFLVE